MSGLTEKAGGVQPSPQQQAVQRAQQAWQESMLRQINALRAAVRPIHPEAAAARCGGAAEGRKVSFHYWDRQVQVAWPELDAVYLPGGEACSTFDTAMLLYYLSTADGTPHADRWVSFRELPGGAFYNQAFQGYSGDRLARAFHADLPAFHRAAKALDGWSLTALAEHAYAFQPLPQVRLAAVLWPGDEEFPTRATILFDAAASHYLTTDGLALLGSGLARRLEKQAKS